MTLPLETLRIRAFRGLRDIKLEGLGRINLLVGANNSGKTSVLEAIDLYCHPTDTIAWLGTAWSRDDGLIFGGTKRSLEWLFPQHRLSDLVAEAGAPTIDIAATGGIGIRRVEAFFESLLGTPISSGDSGERSSRESPGAVSGGIESAIRISTTAHADRGVFDNSFTWWERSGLRELSVSSAMQGPTFKTSFVDSRGRVQASRQQARPKRLQLRNQMIDAEGMRLLLGILRMFDPQVRDVRYVPEPEEIFVETEALGMCPLSTFGDGLRRALEIAIALTNAWNGILLIDELEAAIHPDGLRPFLAKLLEACKLGNVQLFATTHSLETVDALAAACEDEPDDTLTLYRLEGSDTKRPVVRMSKSEMRIMRHSFGAEVR